MKTTLVVMAAGMGSRFGGLKQAEPVTKSGLGILDFSIYDAKKAGFSKVVFILREDMAEDFKNLVGKRIEKTMPVEYVIQDTSILPAGRTKPFGTGHAILSCKDVVKEPFLVINADDYYGPHAFEQIEKFLENAKGGEFAMVPYMLGNTLSPNGDVTRGVCKMTKDGYLEGIEEVSKINSKGHCVYNGVEQTLPHDTPVSMNIWGLTPFIFEVLEKEFKKFLETANLSKDEFYIPLVVGDCVKSGIATVKGFPNTDAWHGITYREDLPDVKDALKGLIDAGQYPGLE